LSYAHSYGVGANSIIYITHAANYILYTFVSYIPSVIHPPHSWYNVIILCMCKTSGKLRGIVAVEINLELFVVCELNDKTLYYIIIIYMLR